MIPKHFEYILKAAAVCLMVLLFAGCKEEAAKSGKEVKTGEAQAPAQAPEISKPEAAAEAMKSLPTVTLTGVKIQSEPGAPSTKINIAASGAFGSNVVPKTEPVRLIAILHNATIGNAPKSIDVNNGTVKRVEIAQLDTGKAPAVRVTIGLDKKTAFRTIAGDSALTIEVKNVK